MAIEIGTKKQKVRPSMNVTPLVDVVLVLLIIFMVITPLLTRQLSVAVPTRGDEAAEAPPDDAEPQVVLTVDAAGDAWVNRDRVADRELAGKLKRVFAARQDQTLFFDAAGDLAYGRALEVLDLARGAGVVTIAVLTEPIRH